MPQHKRFSDYDRYGLVSRAPASTHRSYPNLQYGFFTMTNASKDLRKTAAVEIVPMIPKSTSYRELRRYDFPDECKLLWESVQNEVKAVLLSRGIFGRRVKNPEDYRIEAYRTENTTALKVRDDWLGVAVPLFDRPVPIRFAGADDDQWEPEDVLYFTETGFKLPGNAATVLYVIFRLEEL
ncbi:hypothetical protein B0T10DRAFT_495251, partial [Thelonectria olida]